MANLKFIASINTHLKLMESIAIKRDAAVFRAEKASSDSPFKILVFTMLSSRTKDETTILALDRLFSIAKTPKEVSLLTQTQLEKILYGVGFYRTKSKNLIELSRVLSNLSHFPKSLDDLMRLPGVGRKTANIVLARVYGLSVLGVDTHVHRISNRLGLVKTKKPLATEQKLILTIPNKYLSTLNRTFVAFGQTVCKPTNPDCKNCPISVICPKIDIKN